MTTFGDTRAGMAAKLTAAGSDWHVTTDPAALAPFILVDLCAVTAAEGVGAWTCTIPVRVVVPGPGDGIAAAALEDGLQLVLTTLGFARADPARYTTGDGKDLPSYVCAYTARVPNPYC